MIKGSELNCKISGIKENVTYVAKISAINAAGEGQFSELRTFSRGEWWTEEKRGIEGDGGMDRGGGGRGVEEGGIVGERGEEEEVPTIFRQSSKDRQESRDR